MEYLFGLVVGVFTGVSVCFIVDGMTPKPAPDRECVISRYDVCVQSGAHPSTCMHFAEEVCRGS